jgi:hypothetical protein
MEFPWDGQQWKRNSRGYLKVKNQQGIFQGVATNREINKEIPLTRSEIVKVFSWDGLEVKTICGNSMGEATNSLKICGK